MERLEKLYRQFTGTSPVEVCLLPISGSARKYYRMTGAATMIGCIGTNTKENNAFVTIARQMRAKGINAPEVYAVSDDGMAYIQEDLGDCQLFGMLKPAIEKGKYGDSDMAILRKVMQALPSPQYL